MTGVYSIGIVCTSIGYASFSLSRRFIKGEGKRKLLIALFALGYLFCTLGFMLSQNAALFTVFALLSLLLFGYIGGFTHYASVLFLFGKRCSGRVVGAALALAILLQFIVQNLFVTDVALIVSLFFSVCGILYLVLKPVKDWMFEKLIEGEATNKDIAQTLYISTRVLERYIASIYEKTGVQSRVGLVKLYYQR